MENTQQCLTTNNRPRGGVCEDIYTTDILCLKKINNVFLIINLNFKAMRKSTLLKVAGTFAAVMFSFGVMAQTYPATINHTGDETDYVEATTVTYQTVGYGLKLYAAPDPIYSPSYDGTGAIGNGLNTSSQWRWVYGVNFATGTLVKDWANQNWVEIPAATIATPGDITFWAAERFGTAGCADGTGQSHVVTVLPAPDGTMVGANTAAAWTVMTADREFYRCGEGHTDDFTFTFSEAGTPYAVYAAQITVTATGYDAGGAVAVAEHDVTAAYGLNVDPTTFTVASFVAAPAFTTPAMQFENDGTNDVRTKYVYTLSGVSSRVLTLSQKRAGVAEAYVAPTVAQTVTYWLNLPPVTGPIYHIPNDYAY